MNHSLGRSTPVSVLFGISAATLVAAAIPVMGISFPFMGGGAAAYELLLAAVIGLALLIQSHGLPPRPMTRLVMILGVVLAIWVLVCNFVLRPFESVYMWE